MTRGRVLVVDDNETVLRVHRLLVERAGFEVHTAEDGVAALTALEQGLDVDTVLSDIEMPRMGGVALLREIRSWDADLPVIFLTGAPQLSTAIDAVEHGALRYLEKPVNRMGSTTLLDRAVNLRRLARLKQEALTLLAEQERRVVDELQAREAFERALDGIWLAAQPIVSLRHRKVVAYEALLRTREPTVAGPERFLEMAARVDSGMLLGRAIRGLAAQLSSRLGDETDLLVNLDARDLLDPALYLANAPLSLRASHIVLELTERAPLETIGGLAERITRLRALGFRVAIDDLGAGYAGLSSLAQLDAEVAKIDMSLVRGIDSDPRKAKLVSALAQTCAALGQRVVVEGVETAAERDRLGELGCDLMQGFFFGHPLEHPAAVADGAFTRLVS